MARVRDVAADSGVLPADDERLRAETQRIYAASAWVGPVGAAALTAILASVLWDVISPVRLAAWATAVAIGALGQIVSIVAPGARRWTAPNGLPWLTHPAHLLVGLSYGSLLWLDASIVATAEYRWACLMAMFALSAGVSTGLAGLHNLGMLTIAPVWALGSAALLLDGQWLIGVGGLFFLLVEVVDQRRSGALWRELVALRIDHERRAEHQRWLAEHDALTGLINRAGVLERLRSMKGPMSAMFVDLDGFKLVNDEYGHDVGDQVLAEVGHRLQSLVGGGDIVARLGGDEFLILLDRAIDVASLAEMGRRAIEVIERPIETTTGVTSVSASVGVDSVGSGGDDPTAILVQADHALLQAKRSGRRCVVVFEAPTEAHPDVTVA